MPSFTSGSRSALDACELSDRGTEVALEGGYQIVDVGLLITRNQEDTMDTSALPRILPSCGIVFEVRSIRPLASCERCITEIVGDAKSSKTGLRECDVQRGKWLGCGGRDDGPC